MNFQRTRKYPDYVTCPVPDYVRANDALPVEAANVGKPFPGCAPYAPVSVSAGSDPDVITPVGVNAYVHPSLPGLLLRTVKTRTELFRAGSSYIFFRGTSVGHMSTAHGYFGADAEAAVLGECVAQWPCDGATSPPYKKRARTTAEADALLNKLQMPLTDANRLFELNQTAIEENLALAHIFEGNSGALTPASMAIPYAGASGKLDTVVPSGTDSYIMAVMTSSERGWYHWNGNTNGAGADYCHGAMYDYVDVTTVEKVVALHVSAWLAGMDDDFRKYCEQGLREELLWRKTAFPGGEPIRAPMGVAAVTKSNTLPANAAAFAKLWSPGFLVPSAGAGHVNSANALNYPGPNGVGMTHTLVVAAKVKDFDVVQDAQLAQRHLWGHANLNRRSQKFSAVPMEYVNQGGAEAMTVKRWMERSARYVAMADSASITSVAMANGSQTMNGGALVTVPSLLGKSRWASGILNMVQRSEFAGLPTFLVAEVFRRAYARAEAIARSSF